MKKLIAAKNFILFTSFLSFYLFYAVNANAQPQNMDDIKQIKAEILRTANSFKGQGDPDFKKQRILEIMVEKLIKLSPQKNLKERLPELAGAWYQVWGSYDYRKSDSRSVDPDLDVNNAYQVISPNGYYYNVSLLKDKSKGKTNRIGLLRGEYVKDPNNTNGLRVHFTKYPGTDISKNDKTPFWQLANLAESEKLANPISIVPTWIVKLFFKDGILDEVYTDKDLRITYGSRPDGKTRQLFILTKASN